MTYLNCPRCNLSVHVRASYLVPRNCPRCIARRQVAVPMYETPALDRVAAGSAPGAPPAAPPFQLRRASGDPGTDTAA